MRYTDRGRFRKRKILHAKPAACIGYWERSDQLWRARLDSIALRAIEVVATALLFVGVSGRYGDRLLG